MLKKLIPLIFTALILTSCNDTQSSANTVTSSNDTVSSIISSLTGSSESEEQVLPSSETKTEEPVVSTSLEPVDEFAGLSADARKVAEYLKNNESTNEVSYFKITVSYFSGGITLIRQFSYHYKEQLFVTFCELLDEEDDVTANGYVIFEWGKFLKGYFGGNFKHGDLYIQDMQFYEMTMKGLEFGWTGAAYGETNYPNPTNNSDVIAGFNLAFDCLQEGIDYSEEFLNDDFSPSLSLI